MFSFQVVSDSSVDPALVKDAQYALSQWSDVLNGQGTLLVDLRVTSTAVGRANNDTTQVPTGAFQSGRSVSISSPAYELTTGRHAPNLPDGTSSDLVINIDPAYLQTLYVDPNPSTSSVVPKNEIDAVSVFEHEIGHGLGMTGFYPLTATSQNDLLSGFASKYDSYVQFQNGQPVFVGPHAEAANGGNPVPLTDYPRSNPNSSQNIYHLGMSLTDSFGNDLMTGSAFQFGMRYVVSAVDAGIIEDASGLTPANAAPNPPPPAPNPPPSTLPPDNGPAPNPPLPPLVCAANPHFQDTKMDFIHHQQSDQDQDHGKWAGLYPQMSTSLAHSDFGPPKDTGPEFQPPTCSAGAWEMDVHNNMVMAGHH